MGRTVNYKEQRQTKAQQEPLEALRQTTTPSEPEVSLEERSFVTDHVEASETYCPLCCDDCYHKRSNWSKFLDWLREVLWLTR